MSDFGIVASDEHAIHAVRFQWSRNCSILDERKRLNQARLAIMDMMDLSTEKRPYREALDKLDEWAR